MVSLIRYPINDAQRKTFAGTLVMHRMAKEKKQYDVLLPEADLPLQPTLEHLLLKELVTINDKHFYELSPSGLTKMQDFTVRYQTILSYFDLFAHLDLGTGEFAMSSYDDFSGSASWNRFLHDERWEDLRLPIFEHLKGNPLEFIFSQFIHEDRLTTQNPHWQLDIAHGTAWEEIAQICEHSIHKEELKYEDDQGTVTADSVLDDIIDQGFNILRELNPADASIHSNLQAWYPRQGKTNFDLPPVLPGWEKPIWQTPWTL